MNRYLVLITAALLLVGCAYKFNGASIPPTMKTVNVLFFENIATLVEPTLAQKLTEDFKTRIRNQSRLSLSTSANADGLFESRITGYDIKPISIENNANGGLSTGANRLTITVSVKYTNNADTTGKSGFDENFSAFTDFPPSTIFESQKESLINKVTEQLTENIFNRAFSQW